MSGQIQNKKIKRTIIWNGESTSLAIPSTWDDIYSTSNKAKGNELIVSRLSLRESDRWIMGPANNVHFHSYQIYLYSAKNSSGPNRLTLHSAAAFFHMGLTALMEIEGINGTSSATELGFFSCSSCVWFFHLLFLLPSSLVYVIF